MLDVWALLRGENAKLRSCMHYSDFKAACDQIKPACLKPYMRKPKYNEMLEGTFRNICQSIPATPAPFEDALPMSPRKSFKESESGDFDDMDEGAIPASIKKTAIEPGFMKPTNASRMKTMNAPLSRHRSPPARPSNHFSRTMIRTPKKRSYSPVESQLSTLVYTPVEQLKLTYQQYISCWREFAVLEELTQGELAVLGVFPKMFLKARGSFAEVSFVETNAMIDNNIPTEESPQYKVSFEMGTKSNERPADRSADTSGMMTVGVNLSQVVQTDEKMETKRDLSRGEKPEGYYADENFQSMPLPVKKKESVEQEALPIFNQQSRESKDRYKAVNDDSEVISMMKTNTTALSPFKGSATNPLNQTDGPGFEEMAKRMQDPSE